MSEQNEYVCTLDKNTVQKAKDELNEIPEDRLSAVQALRDWIEEQPHLKCPETNTSWLLRFLRGTKFSQLRAREKLENYLSLFDTYPEWFHNLDTHDPKILRFIDSGAIVLLPKPTIYGASVIMYRLDRLDKLTKKCGTKDRLRCVNMLMDYVWTTREASQVHGFVLLMDCTGGSASTFTNKESKQCQNIVQKCVPGRFKGVYFYQPGIIFGTVIEYLKTFLRSKYISRLRNVDTAEQLYTDIPMETLPAEYLPDEYTGPCAGTFDEISKNLISCVTDKKYREDILYRTSHAFGVDESKRPQPVTQHFRKLTID